MSGQFRQVAYKLPWGKIRGLSIGNPNSKNVYVCLHGWQDNCGLFKPLLSKLPQVENNAPRRRKIQLLGKPLHRFGPCWARPIR